MRPCFVLVALLLIGCPTPPPRPTPMPAKPPVNAPWCSDSYAITEEDVCANQFMRGLVCVRCPVLSPCISRREMVYCTDTCLDPECIVEIGMPGR